MIQMFLSFGKRKKLQEKAEKQKLVRESKKSTTEQIRPKDGTEKENANEFCEAVRYYLWIDEQPVFDAIVAAFDCDLSKFEQIKSKYRMSDEDFNRFVEILKKINLIEDYKPGIKLTTIVDGYCCERWSLQLKKAYRKRDCNIPRIKTFNELMDEYGDVEELHKCPQCGAMIPVWEQLCDDCQDELFNQYSVFKERKRHIKKDVVWAFDVWDENH